MIMIGIVLQARIDSSRLPGKSLLPLGGKPLIFRVMEALNRVPAELRILACPEDAAAAFAPLADEAGFALFTGPKDDVLARYCLALRKFGIHPTVSAIKTADTSPTGDITTSPVSLLRATGDNPFVFADAAAAINAEAIALNADYAGYTGLPHGTGVESVSAGALFRAEAEAVSPYDREHVCPYLYTHPELFRLHRPPSPPHWQGADIRLTVDTAEDYERAQALFAVLDRSGEERYQGSAIIAAYRELYDK